MNGRPGRVALGVVTFVALGAGWFALVAPRSDRAGSRSPITAAPSSIWPEGPFDAPEQLSLAQSRVDAGRDRWRLRADAVVAHFVQSTFGWITVEIADAAERPTAGPVTYEAREDCGSLCEGLGGGGWVAVTVDRLLDDRDGTVWSVVAVGSDRLRLPVEAGDVVVAGESLPFGLSIAEDRHAAVGVRYAQPPGDTVVPDCGNGFAGEAGVTDAEVSVTIPDPPFDDASCSAARAVGYVFAYTTTRLTVQTGDPLVEPVYLTDLSIVPVVIA
jgi:hypothetical protein